MSIQIVDTYSQSKFDAKAEAATGTDGVLFKGGQGEWPDLKRVTPERIKQAEDAGLPWGIYWQMDARYSAEKHKACIKAQFPDGNFGKLGLWLAVELPFYPCPDWMYWKMTYAGHKMIESVWRGVHAYTGVYPGIYTSISKWNLIFRGCPDVLKKEFAEKSKLWVAQYKVSKPDPIGAWGNSWTLWQYQEGPDYSVFQGTEEQFRQVFNLSDIPQPAEPEPPESDGLTDLEVEYQKGYANGRVSAYSEIKLFVDGKL